MMWLAREAHCTRSVAKLVDARKMMAKNIFRSRNVGISIHPSASGRQAGEVNFGLFRPKAQACRRASTGLSLAARIAGYRPAIKLTPAEKNSARMTSHIGTYQKSCGFRSWRVI